MAISPIDAVATSPSVESSDSVGTVDDNWAAAANSSSY